MIDLEVGTTSTLLKLADDTKLFRPVVSQADRSMLQNDLNTVCEWADVTVFDLSCKFLRYYCQRRQFLCSVVIF